MVVSAFVPIRGYVLVIAAVTIGASSVAFAASGSHKNRQIYLRTGDNVHVGGLDLRCLYAVSGAGRNFMLCQRNSDAPHSISVIFYSGRVIVQRNSDSLTIPDKVLYQHARNP